MDSRNDMQEPNRSTRPERTRTARGRRREKKKRKEKKSSLYNAHCMPHMKHQRLLIPLERMRAMQNALTMHTRNMIRTHAHA